MSLSSLTLSGVAFLVLITAVKAASESSRVPDVGGSSNGLPLVEPVALRAARRGQDVTTTNTASRAEALRAQCGPVELVAYACAQHAPAIAGATSLTDILATLQVRRSVSGPHSSEAGAQRLRSAARRQASPSSGGHSCFSQAGSFCPATQHPTTCSGACSRSEAGISWAGAYTGVSRPVVVVGAAVRQRCLRVWRELQVCGHRCIGVGHPD